MKQIPEMAPFRHLDCGLLLGLSLLMWGCASTGPPPPSSPYRADITVRLAPAGSEPVTTRIVEKVQDGKRRRSGRPNGAPVVVIDRPELKVTWVLHPESKTFDEVRTFDANPDIGSLPDPFGPRARNQFEVVGQELVDGIEATKFAVDGKYASGFAWLNGDGVPIRFDGFLIGSDPPTEIELIYERIEAGQQPAYEFGIPQNYAGFETRKQKASWASPSNLEDEVDEAKRRLQEQQQRTRPQGIPPY